MLFENFSGETHALAVGKLAAAHYFAAHVGAVDFFDAEYDKTVVYGDGVACFQVVGQPFIVYRDNCVVPHDVARRESKVVAVAQRNGRMSKGFNAVFRSLCVQHYRDGQIKFFAHLFYHVDFLLVFFVRPVRKI